MKSYPDKFPAYPPSILIIAPNSGPMFKLKQKLETKGCRVDWIDTGVDSLARLRHRYFDAIVLDHERPALNDFETVLNAAPELLQIPILLLTPSDGVEELITGLKIEITHYLIKSMLHPEEPYDEEILLNIVNQIGYLSNFQN
jgi:DNA-binding response OmpR family regulator